MAQIKSISEQQLLQHCLQNKEWAQKQLYDMYNNRFYPICLRYATNIDDAKDMLQEGFIRIFTNIKQFKGDGSLEGWMRRVIVTTALNYLKKHQKHLHKDVETINEENYAVNNTYSIMEVKDIMQCFQLLPYAYKVVLNLYTIEGYSYGEISGLLQIEESSCRTRVFRAKQLLQKIFLSQQENATGCKQRAH
jgi:RNA polymerase sigma factor (sigma-70 family)